MSVDLRLSIGELSRSYADRSLSVVEVISATLERVATFDPSLRSYLCIRGDEAMAEAHVRDADLRAGTVRGPLHGIPVAVKDLIDVEGMTTTGGSVLQRDDPPAVDAEMVGMLRAAGAIVIGKHNLYEFGLGLPTDGEWPEAARNPWDLARIPGGSSSGSAVAVAAALCAGAFGTDTGGSIRGPASYCGVVGLKPTHGTISTAGCQALSWTLDHIGPLARTVDDAAVLLTGASGRALEVTDGIDGIRIGVPRTLMERVDMEADVGLAFEEAVRLIESSGWPVASIELPDLEITEAALLAIIGSEGLAAHLATLAERPEAYGRSARERLSGGLVYSGVDYVNALRVRDVVIEELDKLYGEVDVIVSPVTLQVAPTNADFQRNPPHRTPFTGIHNLTGGPAMSVPAGFDQAGMPIGMQIAGPHGADALVLSVARWYQRATTWHTAVPTVLTEAARS